MLISPAFVTSFDATAMRRSHHKHRSKTTISWQSPAPTVSNGKFYRYKTSSEVEFGERCFRNVRFSYFCFGWLLTSSSAAFFFVLSTIFLFLTLSLPFLAFLIRLIVICYGFANFNLHNASIGVVCSLFQLRHQMVMMSVPTPPPKHRLNYSPMSQISTGPTGAVQRKLDLRLPWWPNHKTVIIIW
jgi:hypothetical protein